MIPFQQIMYFQIFHWILYFPSKKIWILNNIIRVELAQVNELVFVEILQPGNKRKGFWGGGEGMALYHHIK